MKHTPTFFFFFFFFLSHLFFAQQMPVDFSDPSENFSSFLGCSFSLSTDPENPNNQVGQFFNDFLRDEGCREAYKKPDTSTAEARW